MDYEAYLRTTYAAWLGKLIGIRLGAPVENWTNAAIVAKYGTVTGYLVDYDIFAADDDSNGPLFFVRALLHNDLSALTPKVMGDNVLNYLQEYRGFFWWGGLGISTEHTAYENLKNGISAPASGSIAVNGQALAEQIGGQIFSDCWGYVSGHDPLLARRLAVMAASVTHDGNGIQGAIFVAVAICLAYDRDDVKTVIADTLTYLDAKMEYSRVVRDIVNFSERNDDWHECLTYIQKNYGYDRYPGVCHIIPNAALMIMAMCYGNNEFSQTLTILCECGWDTDCNCGNVGSIMGALQGLSGIDERWILPINDTINASSMVGYLNITTVSYTARLFTELARWLKGDIPELPVLKTCDFQLPYATNGFRGRNAAVHNEDGRLVISGGAGVRFVYKYSYYLPGDLYDTRYDPAFSPQLYPHETLVFTVASDHEIKLKVYVRDTAGNNYYGPVVKVSGIQRLAFQIPDGLPQIVYEYGLVQIAAQAQNNWSIMDCETDKQARFRFDFTRCPTDHYGRTFDQRQLDNIQGWVVHSGAWHIGPDGLTGHGEQHGLITSGDIGFRDYSLTAELAITGGYNVYIIFCAQGSMYYKAVGFERDALVFIEKNGDAKVRKSVHFNWNFFTNYILKIDVKNAIMKLTINEIYQIFETAFINTGVGIYGYMLDGGSSCTIKWFELDTTNLNRKKGE